MSKHRLEINEKCKSCKGTGLYTGYAEHDGIAVVCSNCKGTGCYHRILEYEDFECKEKRNEVKRVIETNPGISCGVNDRYTFEHFGGMSYEDWFNGKPFPCGSEMRLFTCPAWWYQCADYKKKPDWKECSGAGMFTNCKHFPNKSKCWERWDEEYGK